MDAETQKKIDEIWAVLHAGAVRGNEIERRSNEAHQKAMARMDKMEREHEKAMARMDKFERSLGGIRKILLIGAKEMIEMRRETRELKRMQKAFLASRNGRNGGNGHRKGG